MIGAVALAGAAAVVTCIAGFTGRQTAEAVRGEELPGAGIDHGLLLFQREQITQKRNGEDLIGAEGAVVAQAWNVDDIVTTAALCVPEFLKTFRGFDGQNLVALARLSEPVRKLRHRFERFDPE